MYVNGQKIYQFEAKYSDIKPYPLCFGNISKDFTVTNMKKLDSTHVNFSVDLNTTEIKNITDIHKYLMKKHNINDKMFRLFKQVFIVILSFFNH